MDVLRKVIALPTIVPFFGLARSEYESRRDLVDQWLVFFGVPMMALEELVVSFGVSTITGFLDLAARSQSPHKVNFRRLTFEIMQSTFIAMRAPRYGGEDYLEEPTIDTLMHMCLIDTPALQLSVVKLVHSFIAKDETTLLERLWHTGNVHALCDLFFQKSAEQRNYVNCDLKLEWEHESLILIQTMILRLVAYYERTCDRADFSVFLDKSQFLPGIHDFVCTIVHHPNVQLDIDLCSLLITVSDFFAHCACDETCALLCTRKAILTILQQWLPNVAYEKIILAHEEQLFDLYTPNDMVRPVSIVGQKLCGTSLVALLMGADGRHFVMGKAFSYSAQLCLGQMAYWQSHVSDSPIGLMGMDIMTMEERFMSVYFIILSRMSPVRLVEVFGFPKLAIAARLCVYYWACHPNAIFELRALRMLSALAQVKPIWVNMFDQPDMDTLLAMWRDGIKKTLSNADARHTRLFLRFLVATVGHVFNFPVVTKALRIVCDVKMALPESAAFAAQHIDGSILRANRNAMSLLTRDTFTLLMKRADSLEDSFARTWCCWLALVFLSNTPPAVGTPAAPMTPEDHGEREQPAGDEGMMRLAEIDIDQVVRRTSFGCDEKTTPDYILDREPEPPAALRDWMTPNNANMLARICNSALQNHHWPTSIRLGATCASMSIVESTAFLATFVAHAKGAQISNCYALPYPLVHFSVLTLACILTSIKLAPRSETIREAFLQPFFALQGECLHGVATPGNVHPTQLVPRPNSPDDVLDPATPYSLIMKWFHFTNDLDYGHHLRALASFIFGQCCLPPTMSPPMLGIPGATGEDVHTKVARAIGADENLQDYPAVAMCPTPPVELFDMLAAEIKKEDAALRHARASANERGPMWSTLLMNAVYALAVMVPFYPKPAAHSTSVRGATLGQLMKIQAILNTGLQAKDLYADEEDCKLFLYVRATSVIRMALQCVTSSWLAAGFGSRFAVSEEGGYDLIQFCIKHILHTYSNKYVMMKALGTPWERMMMNQGPTQLLCELFLKICSSDGNLIKIARMPNAHKALHSLSRYAEPEVRPVATQLLTKVAMIQLNQQGGMEGAANPDMSGLPAR
eukprot:GEMP01000244.1.p1 GENE.GEMP01000244.1~~GEMP01000244.1.p1  ORF type:complete len:1089 (+),score=233.94 GEMP01000244.1:4462-7728(+)